MTEHPFPYIEELKDISEINSFEKIIRINDFVYSLVPFTSSIMSDSIDSSNIEEVYTNFKNKKYGGWCSLNANFMVSILKGYGIPAYCYDYGIKNKSLNGYTHMCVIVDYLDMKFLFDPYFSRYYVFEGSFPLQFEDLINLLYRRSFVKISSVFGRGKKPFLTEQGWNYIMPQEFLNIVFNGFYDMGLKSEMEKVFMDMDPMLLILLGQR